MSSASEFPAQTPVMRENSVPVSMADQLRETSWIYLATAISGAGILLLILLEFRLFT
jgi:hypothetical protein